MSLSGTDNVCERGSEQVRGLSSQSFVCFVQTTLQVLIRVRGKQGCFVLVNASGFSWSRTPGSGTKGQESSFFSLPLPSPPPSLLLLSF